MRCRGGTATRDASEDGLMDAMTMTKNSEQTNQTFPDPPDGPGECAGMEDQGTDVSDPVAPPTGAVIPAPVGGAAPTPMPAPALPGQTPPGQEDTCKNLQAFLRILHEPGEVFEIRALKCPKSAFDTFRGTCSGYFNDVELAAREAAKLDYQNQPGGIYVTLNAGIPDLLARANNQLVFSPASTTSDSEITRRRWLMLDLDPVRPSDISATDEEMNAALDLARHIRSTLSGEGWPEPLLAMSGNGAYLLYRVDLPNDDASAATVKGCLRQLAARFDTDEVKVDQATCNASRLVKLLGTTARKGDHLVGIDGVQGRPHRRSWLESPANDPSPVPQQLLEELGAATTPTACPQPTTTDETTPDAEAGEDNRLHRCIAFLRELPDAISGQDGHGATFRAACECFRFGLADDQATEAMGWFNENKTGGDPWSKRELEHKLKDAKTRMEANGEVGTRLGAKDTPGAIESASPLRLAEHFLDHHHRDEDGRLLLRRWRGDFRRFEGCSYRHVSDEVLDAAIYGHLDGLQTLTPGKGSDRPKAKKLKVNSGIVREVRLAIPSRGALLGDDIEAPAWLDGRTDVEPRDLLVCRNGLLHLPTGGVHPPTPEFLALNALGVAHCPNAPEPTAWLEFLGQLWPNDPEAISTLQQWAGYLLTPDTRQQKILLLVGPKRSGKGTIARVLTRMLGKQNVASPTLGSLAKNFGLAPLLDKLLATVSDARLSGRTDQAAVVERLLAISGEDHLTVDRKHVKAITVRLPARFMLLTNELPRFTDTSGALASRFIILQLTESFYGREDHGLTDRLLEELPGILNWSIEGWRALRCSGRFLQPESGAEMISELEDLSSPVGSFVRDRCVVGPEHRCEIDKLFGGWTQWCREQGRDHPGTKNTFARDLRAAIPGLKTRQVRIPGGRIRAYQGLDLICPVGVTRCHA